MSFVRNVVYRTACGTADYSTVIGTNDFTQAVTKEDAADTASTNSTNRQTVHHPQDRIVRGSYRAMSSPQLQPPVVCGSCSTSFVGHFCPNCGWTIAAPVNSPCWNCGSAVSGRYCSSCGTNTHQRPRELIDEDAAAARGAVQGGIIWGLFSGKDDRARNALIGAAWGGLAEQGNARRLNELFQCGASISAITDFRSRRVWASLVNVLAVLGYLSLMVMSDQSEGAFILSAFLTWPLCVTRDRVARWSYEPLDREHIVKASFGRWMRADPATVQGYRQRRARLLLIIGVACQVAVGVGGLS